MKQTLLLALLCTLFLTPASAQTKEAQKISEVGLESCDSTTSHLDNFLMHLINNPNDTGYVIYYDGYRLAKNRKYAIWRDASYRLGFFKRLFRFRKADASRIVYLNGGYREEYSVEFWLVPKGAETPKPSNIVNPKDKKFKNFRVIRKILNCGEEGF